MAHSTEKQADERENDELRSKRFGGRDADLRSGVHVNAAIALARDRARDVVANPERAITFAPAFAQRAERIGGFTALADGKNEGVVRSWACCDDETRSRIRLRSECWPDIRSDIRRPCRRAARCRNPSGRRARRRAIPPDSYSSRRAWQCILPRLRRPRMASRTESGCSKISLSM